MEADRGRNREADTARVQIGLDGRARRWYRPNARGAAAAAVRSLSSFAADAARCRWVSLGHGRSLAMIAGRRPTALVTEARRSRRDWSHPAWQCTRTLPLSASLIERLGFLSSWEGQGAIQWLPVRRPPRARASVSAFMRRPLRWFSHRSRSPFLLAGPLGKDGEEAGDVLDDLARVLPRQLAPGTPLPHGKRVVDVVGSGLSHLHSRRPAGIAREGDRARRSSASESHRSRVTENRSERSRLRSRLIERVSS